MARPNSSLSVIVAALDEERGLEKTVRNVVQTVPRWFEDWEILIINDGSTDRTGEIADRLAASLDRVTAVHHDRPHCLGGVMKDGLRLARMDYVILIDGKDDTSADTMDRIFSYRGRADLIIPVQVNGHERPWIRRLLSRTFVSLLNLSFGLDLRYYNHSVLHRRHLIESIRLRTDSYGFQAEAVIKLLRMGCTYEEVEVTDRFHPDEVTKAFTWSNLTGISRFFLSTLYDVYLAHYGGLASVRPGDERKGT